MLSPKPNWGLSKKFNLQVLQKRDHQRLMFLLTFFSEIFFRNLKLAVMDLLRQQTLYMNRHQLDANTLDVGIAGWILRAQPRYQSPHKQKELMQAAIQTWWNDAAPEEKACWGNIIEQDDEGICQGPNFFVNARSVNEHSPVGRRIQVPAFLIMTPAKITNACSALLENVFTPTATNDKIQFVPARLQISHQPTYSNLILEHRRLLSCASIIAIAVQTKN